MCDIFIIPHINRIRIIISTGKTAMLRHAMPARSDGRTRAGSRPRTTGTVQGNFREGIPGLALPFLLLLLLAIPAAVSADSWVGGLPLTTVQAGTVTGDFWFNATPAPDWGSHNVTKTFTLPAASVGNIVWARLYISAYCGNMLEDRYIAITNSFDGNGDGTSEQVWAEPGHAAFEFTGQGGCNDNTALGGGSCDPWKMINDHENRVTSDYFMWYNVTGLITAETVNVTVNTEGSYDGRIKVITLAVAYDDPVSEVRTTYRVNQGHDACTYYTENNTGKAAVGSTSFATTGLSGITAACLTASYMASNNGYYGFPTAENNFTYTGGSPPVGGNFTNLTLDRAADVQGPFSGVDSWDVTSIVAGSPAVTFAYARYFPAGGTAAFFKIPLVFLVAKEPLPVTAPVADFTADVTNGTAPLTVAFADASANRPTSWSWDFGDGDPANATVRNPVHTYAAPGTYTVNLTVSNSAGSDSEEKTGYITVTRAPPVADFTASPLSGEAPLAVTFNDTSAGSAISGYQWIFSDNPGTVFSGPDLSHMFTDPGVYSVNHSAANDGGTTWKNSSGLILARRTPAITALSPKKKAAGGGAFTLTVKGTGLTSASVVQWNGANRTTTFVPPAKVTAKIRAKDVKKKGSRQVTVLNPGPAGGLSNPKVFKVTAAQ